MKTHPLVALGLVLAVLVGAVRAEDAGKKLASGPQAGEELAGPFHPLNVTGAQAGNKHCLYCENGDNPVAMIFARNLTPELETLIKKIDAATAKNSSCEMGSFVVFCNDAEDLAPKLAAFAKKAGLKKIVLSIDNPAGPKGYKVSRNADVTVVLYKERVAKVNFAFKKGEMKTRDVEQIVQLVPKITK